EPKFTKLDQCSDNPKWTTYKHSSYYISSKWKNWNDSRRDCLQRGEYITRVTNANIVWIGLTDSDKDGVWKWVDGSRIIKNKNLLNERDQIINQLSILCKKFLHSV
uniref:C-type lectin domain-containing protein n=1 Tax=Sinocyclocheilus grahami TaxID=75366 RepID=A0A672KKR3_SINGR